MLAMSATSMEMAIKTPTKATTRGDQRDLAMPTFSLELLTKKRAILDGEVHKLEACLRQRTDLLCRLRQLHEELITSNGKQEECFRLREQTLRTLRTALDDAGSPCTNADHLQVAGGKLRLCETLLLSVEKQREEREAACMEKEELLQKQHAIHLDAAIALNQARETEQMMNEDMHAVMVALQRELAVAKATEDNLSMASQRLESKKLDAEETKRRLKTTQLTLEDRRINYANIQEMIAEDVNGLQNRKITAEEELRHVEDLLRKSGAALPEDFDVEEKAQQLTQRLEHLTAGIAKAKFAKRDALLRRKEEVAFIAVAKANVAAREDQLKWLERQFTHLGKEYESMVAARDADEQAYETFKKAFHDQMNSIAQHTTMMAQEAADVSQQIATARARVVEARDNLEARTSQLKSQRQNHAAKTSEINSILDARKTTEEAISNFSTALAGLEAEHCDKMSYAAGFAMAYEDELLHQLRIAEAMATLKQNTDTAKAIVEATNSVEEKISRLRATRVPAAGRGNVARLVQDVTDEFNRATEEEEIRFEDTKQAMRINREQLDARYENLISSMQAKYQQAIDEKRKEHCRLEEALAAKREANAEAAAQAAKAAAQQAEKEKVAAQKKMEADKLAAQEKAEAKKVAAQKKADEERIVEAQRIAAEKAEAENAAAAERIAAEKMKAKNAAAQAKIAKQAKEVAARENEDVQANLHVEAEHKAKLAASKATSSSKRRPPASKAKTDSGTHGSTSVSASLTESPGHYAVTPMKSTSASTRGPKKPSKVSHQPAKSSRTKRYPPLQPQPPRLSTPLPHEARAIENGVHHKSTTQRPTPEAPLPDPRVSVTRVQDSQSSQAQDQLSKAATTREQHYTESSRPIPRAQSHPQPVATHIPPQKACMTNTRLDFLPENDRGERPHPKRVTKDPKPLASESNQGSSLKPSSVPKASDLTGTRVSVGRLESASQRVPVAQATQQSQSVAKATTKKKATASKPAAKTPRQPKGLKTKSRRASQSVDWLDNSGFSFS